MGIFEICILFLVLLAGFDLWVGVTNDAVNFLNSAIGSRVATRRIIFSTAAIGVVIGAFFSNGLMEVARKGVFDPNFFVSSEGLNLTAILAVYMGVMVADIFLLDLYNSFGLPTSTTVSIISELVGASIAVAFWMSGGDIIQTLSIINSGPVLGIYSGIFASVVIAFVTGAIVMFFARLLFSHSLEESFRRVGWLWTGLCFVSLSYFVLFKGLKNVTFLSEEQLEAISGNFILIILPVFLVSSVLAFIFRNRHRLVFTAIILSATCSLAIAFAGNDLVNFIGPTVAAGQAVFIEGIDLGGKVETPTWALLVAGLVMVIGLWVSRKARTVTDTEVRLAAQGETQQRFGASPFARFLVNLAYTLRSLGVRLIPMSFRHFATRRAEPVSLRSKDAAPFDLLRASVNLTVAGALISLGTANQLPLSTTYITFMVAMGAAMADGTWTKNTAAERVTGILTVLGGWLVTGLIAAAFAFVTASGFYLLGLGLGMVIAAVALIIFLWLTSSAHGKRFGRRKTVFDESVPEFEVS